MVGGTNPWRRPGWLPREPNWDVTVEVMVLLLLASLPQAAANGPCARYAEAVLLVLLRRGANCETSGAAAAAAAAAASRLLLLRPPPPPPPPPLIGGKAAEPVEDYDYQIIQQLL